MKNKNINKNEIFKYIVMVYLIISPIFDTVFLYSHITTLFRIIILIGFVIGVLIIYKDSRKKLMYLLAYYIAMGIYLIIDYFHASSFSSLVPDNFNYSILSETTTIIKLSMPFTILFILKYINFTKKEFFRIINSWVILIAGSIVILNIFGLSLGSYTDAFTSYSIFSWGQDLSVNEIATKGWFCYSNQIGILLLLLLVLSFYEIFFINRKYIINILFICLACLMLGTRLATYGGLLVIIFMLISYILYMLLNHLKISKRIVPCILIILFWSLMLPIAPNSSRMQEIKDSKLSVTENSNSDKTIENSGDNEVENVSNDLLYIEQNINKKLVGEIFYKEYYPYQYDTEFWLDIVNRQEELNLNYRKLEVMIIERIIKIDNRKSNILFGISNSIIQNVVNIEKDFVLQYYAFGVIGMVICLAFYIYSSFRVTIETIKNRSFINFSILCCFGLYILGAFVSGNSIHFLATIIPISFVVGAIQKYKD